MIMKLGIQNCEIELCKSYVNNEPGLTFAYFTARSNFFAYVFELGTLLQRHLNEEKNLQKLIKLTKDLCL